MLKKVWFLGAMMSILKNVTGFLPLLKDVRSILSKIDGL
jgi:hypothetical protein